MNKVVLITGGTGSLGRNLIEEFCKAGYCVKFQYYSNDTMAEQLLKKFPGVIAHKVNFENDFNPNLFGEFDILINNAAFCNPENLLQDINDEVWNRVLSVNLTAPFKLAKYILPLMTQKKWGRIINISSIYGVRPIETLTPYSTSKAGMIGFSKGIAKEYAKYGITSNAICPGTIDSDLMVKLGKAYCQETGESLEEYIHNLCMDIPMERLAKPIDITNMVLYLASDAAEYITGETITIDGGTII